LEVAEGALKNSQSTKEAWYLKSIAGGKTKEFNVTSPWASKISSAALHAGLYRKDRETFLYWSEFETILIGNGSGDTAKRFIQTLTDSYMVGKSLLTLTDLPSNTEKKIVRRKFEILLISICTEVILKSLSILHFSSRKMEAGNYPCRCHMFYSFRRRGKTFKPKSSSMRDSS
jgi:hypothetical protein